MTVKEDKVLNQQLDEQLKAELIVKSSLQYVVLYFYITKKDGHPIITISTGLQETELTHNKEQDTTVLNQESN